jgi:asparagine synthase (glutamine-hydrolysing)
MCGIAASFAYSAEAPQINPAELRAVVGAMASRGPDSSGFWSSPDGKTSLGHCRLSIIDLSANSSQPMRSHDESVIVSFNGEIYNYRALRTHLEKKGYVFRTQGDTEVLLHLYAHKGKKMVHDLEGMFAFAIWDTRKKGLFLARDPYGIKPLYYADDGRTFRVASQVKALLSGGGIDTAPEPAGHVGFFLWGSIPEPYTLYKSIRSLGAGCTLWVDPSGKMEYKSFSSLRATLQEAQCSNNAKNTESVRRETITSALQESVRKHLVSDVPVGIFLSSGIDSACLLALASKETSNLRTVTLGFEEYRGTLNDETILAEEMAKHFGAKHQTVWVSKADFQDHSERLLASMDQPSIDGVNTYFVSFAAAQASLKVALSGVGGDELFGGYPSFSDVPRLTQACRAFRHVTPFARAFRAVSAPVLKHFTSPKYAGLFEYGHTLGGAYLLRRGLFMPWELIRILEPDFVREGLDELHTVQRLNDSVLGIKSDHMRICSLESQWYLRNQLLRDADWASMSHSLELRVPLVDSKLLQTLAPLIAGGKLTKRDMACAVEGQLPISVLNRPKTGFSIPVRQWISQGRCGMVSERALRGWAKIVYSNGGATSKKAPQTAPIDTSGVQLTQAAAA